MTGTALDSRVNGFAPPPEPPPLPSWAPPPQDALGPAAPVPPRQGPRAPHIEDWVDVPGYPDHKARIWLNFPQRLFKEINSGDEARAFAAVCQIVLEHNGWCDEDGTPYPAPGATETETSTEGEGDDAVVTTRITYPFWEAISQHQANALMAALKARITTNPLAPAPGRR